MVNPKSLSYTFMGARHQTNDDFSVMNPEQGVYVIADGVSEGGQGKFASQLVTKFIQEKLSEANQKIKKDGTQLQGAKKLQAMQEAMFTCFTDAQTELQKAAGIDQNYKMASTTCIAVWLEDRFAILAHIGDSRAYLYRAGKLYQLTKDHSGLDELIAMGLPLEVAQKNPLAKSLTRAFGNARYTHPDLLKVEFQPNDILFMCTDGVYSALTPQNLQELVTAIQQGREVKDWIQRCSHISGDDSTWIQLQFPAQFGQGTTLQASDRIKLIQQTPLCRYFDYVQKSHLAAICEIEEFKKGSVVLQEGTDGASMYVVASGTLEALVQGQHVSYMKPGEFMGEIALIQQGKRTATVVAKEDATLLSLKKSDLDMVFSKDRDMERLFYKGMLEMITDRSIRQGQEIAKLRNA